MYRKICLECGKVLRNKSRDICWSCSQNYKTEICLNMRGFFSVMFDPLGRISPYKIMSSKELRDLIKNERLPEGSVLERKNGDLFEFRRGELIQTKSPPCRMPMELQ